MAFKCVRVPDPDAASCPGDDDGTGCGCSCITEGTSIVQVQGMANGLPGGKNVSSSFGGPDMPVDLANLLVDVSFAGLSNGATGPGVSLRWSNGMKNGSSFTDIQTGVGINWSLNLTGRVLSLGSDKYVAFFEPTNRGQKFYFTKESDDSFTPTNACKAELEATSTEYLFEGQRSQNCLLQDRWRHQANRSSWRRRHRLQLRLR